MFRKNNILIVIFSILYALNKFLFLKMIKYDPFLNCYLNDIFAPLVLTPFLMNIQIFTGVRRKHLPPCLLEVAVYCCALSVFFEWIVPAYNPRSVADIYDVLAYFVGSMIYFGIVGEKVSHLEWLPLGLRLNSR